MTAYFVTTQGSTEDPQAHIVDFDGTTLSLRESLTFAAGANLVTNSGDVSADGKQAVFAHGLDSGGFALTLINLDSGLSVLDSALGAATGLDAAMSGDAVWAARAISTSLRLSNIDGALTSLDYFSPANAGQDNTESIAVSQTDKNLAAHGIGDNMLALVEFDGTSISELDRVGVMAGSARPGSLEFSPDGQHLATMQGSTLIVYDVSAKTLVEADSVASLTGSLVIWRGSNLYAGGKIFSFDGTLTETGTVRSGTFAVDSLESQVLSGSDASSILTAEDIAGNQIDTLDLAGNIHYIQLIPSLGPTTNEELFNANYADASAADPKITALIRPADVQRSIDTDVSNLKDGPNLYTVEAIFDLGELENLNPYNSTTEKPRVFFVRDDQPGLREGKNLLLKGYQIRSADPSVPVTCTFWGY